MPVDTGDEAGWSGAPLGSGAGEGTAEEGEEEVLSLLCVVSI